MYTDIPFRVESQQSEVADRVMALTAVVQPILVGLLYSIKKDVIEFYGGYEKIPLNMLSRAYRRGDGDCGICFEYAVHDAIMNTQNPSVLERFEDALKLCGISGNTDPSSILFGLEKSGSLQIIDTAKEILTDNSRLLPGTKGAPVKLKKHIDNIALAFNKQQLRQAIPSSISGIWRADLIAGFADTDRWVGTTIKTNRLQLKSDKGLRIGIVPASPGSNDSVREDSKTGLIVCPLPYDRDFVEIFYEGFEIVQQLIQADAQMPEPVNLPSIEKRQVAKWLVERREFPVLDIVIALIPLAQPFLLNTIEQDIQSFLYRSGKPKVGGILVPQPREI